jgi:hypothetical protein
MGDGKMRDGSREEGTEAHYKGGGAASILPYVKPVPWES